MYFETFILTILFKNAKLNIKKQKTKNKKQKKKKQQQQQQKKQPKFSQILGRSEKAKQTSFFFFLGLRKYKLLAKIYTCLPQ